MEGQPPIGQGAQPPQYQAPPQYQPQQPPEKKKISKTAWIVIGVVAFVFVIAAIAGGASSSKKEEEETTTPAPSATTSSGTSSPKPSSSTTTTPAPTPVPASIPYAGSGDSVISIALPEPGPCVLFINGNAGARHFAVKGYDKNGLDTELFVNTTDPYQGYTMDPGGTTVQLEISAVGAWAVESCSVRSMRVLTGPGTISGTGDEVIQVTGSASTATITGNAGGRHFAVIGYNPESNLLVNTTDVYQGTVKFPSKITVITITAVGDWSISLK